MNPLVPILHNGGDQSVDARELHRFLENGDNFSTWFKERVLRYGFVEGVDFQSYLETTKKPSGGRPALEYMVSLDMAKELSMVERSDKGQEARRYFIACENRLREVACRPALPATYGEALLEAGRLAIKAEELESLTVQQRGVIEEHQETIREQGDIIDEQIPKVKALERISAAEGDLCLREAAKIVGLQPIRFNEWLSENGWLYKPRGREVWIARQERIQQGVLKYKAFEQPLEEGGIRLREQVVVTPKGITVLSRKLSVELPLW